jgi:hypothetical protein
MINRNRTALPAGDIERSSVSARITMTIGYDKSLDGAPS